MKLEIEMFDGNVDFRIWRRKIKGMLASQKLLRVLEDPISWPEGTTKDQKEEMLESAIGIMLFHLSDSIIRMLSSSKSLEQNLDEFLRMNIELANSGEGEALSDENQTIIILNSLPESFKEVKSAIKYGCTSITLEEVISALKSKDLEFK
ncbi:uncharacterized protein LOC133832981 [Humulus lupulus]|uniref:uncharacterized protein LOC133832981 n=1 Tax=Humulus lupulus TaxID=3486 RepID=UPI002B406E66|nr:uncharacterized protein LOC133832981 [Humulus lupulus]